MSDQFYFDAIHPVVREIPYGQVMTYGQVGLHAGGHSPRVVGAIMAQTWDEKDVPWHRVVGAGGTLPIGKRSPELMKKQRELLEAEGVAFLENGSVDMKKHQAGNVAEPEQIQFDLG